MEDIGTLAGLLHATALEHGHFEKASPPRDRYAQHLSARQQGRTPQEATAAVDRSMQGRAPCRPQLSVCASRSVFPHDVRAAVTSPRRHTTNNGGCHE